MSKSNSTRSKGRSTASTVSPDARPFGPAFFVQVLRKFLRDRCPDPNEHIPVLEIDLHDGMRLRVCHVVALAPAWVALAAVDEASPANAPLMRTVVVPYDSVIRVSIRATSAEQRHLGFTASVEPTMLVERSSLAESLLSEACCAARGRPSVPVATADEPEGCKATKGGHS